MKNLSLMTMLFLSILFVVTASEAGKGSFTTTQLGHLKLLADISQDLDDEATVLVQINKRDDAQSCICVCRDDAWSCTTTECGMQNQKCENRDWEEGEKGLQAANQLKAFSMVDDGEVDSGQ